MALQPTPVFTSTMMNQHPTNADTAQSVQDYNLHMHFKALIIHVSHSAHFFLRSRIQYLPWGWGGGVRRGGGRRKSQLNRGATDHTNTMPYTYPYTPSGSIQQASSCFFYVLPAAHLLFRSLHPSKGPPPRGLLGTGIDGWLGGDFERPHT
jgi:hypothetical protein